MKTVATLFGLCLVVTSGQAFFSDKVTETLDKLKKNVESVVDAALNESKTKFEDAENAAYELVGQIRDEGEKVAESLYASLRDSVMHTDEEIKRLEEEANGVNVTECTAMGASVHKAALAIVYNASSCVVAKVEEAIGYAEGIIFISQDLTERLLSIKATAGECASDISGIDGTIRAAACIKAALEKATAVSTKMIPSALKDATELTLLIQGVLPSLAMCSSANAIATFAEESSTVVEDVRSCIAKKTEEAESVVTDKAGP
ncbi:uncharacterized protein LOC105695472 [Orussus abietinus]|uniref:uncharacterized protein LOC105695472 n=1 Tax=Orussus abietinus TaxID=222816 RepID=UPI00062523F3|nr:uncharacterized protein LOC105695472 [Orussus abietinus]XP_012272451.1 uncharacterized protein LOC105695472 [Orussus abietinus]XP_012272458.1 uncharacterized protein LOC105695472 [Orussus abietinus]